MSYNLLFVWLAIVALFAKNYGIGYLTTENGYEQWQNSKGFAIFVFLPIVIFVCLSGWQYWGDYYNYLNVYSSLPTNFPEALTYIRAKDDSWLFYAFTYIIKILSGNSIIVYRFALATVQSLPLLMLFRRYSTDYVFSVFLLVATALPIAWMLNGVRQLVAAGIIYLATPLIIEKKYFKMFLVVIFASLFHQTAIIMLPCIFLAQGAAYNKKTNFALVGAVLLTIVFYRVSGAYQNFINATGYRISRLVGDDGAHPLRVLISFVPVFLSWKGRQKIIYEDIPVINYFVNMSIISFGINLIAMVTSGILVARVPLYMTLYTFVLLPYLIRTLYQGSKRNLIFCTATICYLIYYYLLYGRRF